MKFDKSQIKRGMILHGGPVGTNARVDHVKSVPAVDHVKALSELIKQDDDNIERIRFLQMQVAEKLQAIREQLDRERRRR